MSTFKIHEGTRIELNRFKEYMCEQEYSNGTALSYSTYLSRFLRSNILIPDKSLRNSIEDFLEKETILHPKTFKECRAALRLYFKMITGQSLKDKPKIETVPLIAELLKRFGTYSIEIKHIKEATAASELSHVQRFLEYAIKFHPNDFESGLNAKDIRNYVVNEIWMLSDSSKGCIITSIRNFFRCQAFYGCIIHQSIFTLPLSPAVWKHAAFPRTLDVNIFNHLYRIPDENTYSGKRDRCIILLFTELALRCSEVAGLTLDDFNWHDGTLLIRKPKNGSARLLPLSGKLGDALLEYLIDGRPQTDNRTLFVRFRHKSGDPMGSSQIRGVIRRNSAKAGLEDKDCGTHVLRRTAATKLYNSGNSLKLTADILGHESLDSTTHYTKADVSSLHLVASPWPGR